MTSLTVSKSLFYSLAAPKRAQPASRPKHSHFQMFGGNHWGGGVLCAENTLRNVMVNETSYCRSFSSRFAACSLVDEFWVASDEIK